MNEIEILDSKTYYSIDGCWYWIGTVRNIDGYGVLKHKQKWYYVHRFSFKVHNPNVDMGKLFVCHSCDNPLCINPNHLFLGTIQDNLKDCYNKGRHAKGEKSGQAVLTEVEVLEILRMKGNTTQNKIAKMFDVTQSTIYAIHNRKTWKHIQPEAI